MADTPIPNSRTALTDAIREHFSGDAPIAEKAKGFAKARPWTSAAFLGVAAVAVLNRLRSRSLPPEPRPPIDRGDTI